VDLKNRLQNLRQKLAEKETDAILISQPKNRFYLSGFDGSSGWLLITPDKTILATDFRYLERARMQAPDYEIVKIAGDISSWLPQMAGNLNLKRVGFEAGHVTFSMYRRLTEALKKARSQLNLVPLDGVVESLRAIKETEEIELIKEASEMTDNALTYIHDEIHPGMTEQDVAWEIEKFLREEGSQNLPFEVIVASGPNSALPHAKPSSRVIQPGEPIIIDVGARVGGYCSDITRTFCLGTPADIFKKIYDIVLGAQLTAVAIINEDMTGEEADSLAREVVKQAGHGENFGHGLGHGLGLAPHESPRLGPDSSEKLANGMVFTIEPGIYLPGWGGVRIEDVVTMESGKPVVITKANK
jgi:Xaa-Pro aminopeptidase